MVEQSRRGFLALGAACGLSACSLPRGAPVRREVLRGATSPEADFVVYKVDRPLLAAMADWPRVGVPENRGWIGASDGPSSLAIAPGDRLSLRIWDSEENSLLTAPTRKSTTMEELAVAPDGTLFVPYVGAVRVAGATPAAARERIQSALESIVPSVQVQLAQSSGKANSVDVVGGVARAGAYPLADRDTSVLEVIAAAGGVPEGLTNPLVRLMRGGEVYLTSLERLYADPGLDTRLQGGDRVIVAEDQRTFVGLGAAGEETVVHFPQDRLSALEALSLVGGLSDRRADPHGLLILRRYPPAATGPGPGGPRRARVVFSIDLTRADGIFSAKAFEIRPGDVVFPTESPVTSVRTVFGLIGNAFGLVNRVGNI